MWPDTGFVLLDIRPDTRVSPIFSLEAKRCEKVARGSEIAKKKVCFASFRIIAKTDSQAKTLSEKKRKETICK
jgi:hypothetical protein